MLRKLLIPLILPIVAATGCCQTLERIEVWKQQTFFSPPAALRATTTDPCAPAASNCTAPCGTQPAATPYYSQTTTTQKPLESTTEYATGETVISDEAVPAQSAPSLGPAGSPEVIDGVLEQP